MGPAAMMAEYASITPAEDRDRERNLPLTDSQDSRLGPQGARMPDCQEKS
jgi:hypothetical protein